MLKIGLIDHHLNNYHSDTFLRLTNGSLAGDGAKIVAAWESNPVGDDWCVKNKVKRCNSMEEVISEADYIMLMAPDNIDFHLEFAKKILPFKKPTFLDKFLAPSIAEAKEIIDLAKRNGVSIMSSSSLAFAVELEAVKDSIPQDPQEMYCRGLAQWAGYGVHTIAPVIKVMGPDFKRLIDTGTPEGRIVTLDYGSGKKALIEVRHAENEWDLFPWQFGIKVDSKYIGATIKDFDGFYSNLMKQIIQFFKTGKAGFSVEQSLAVVEVLEGAIKSQQANGQWLNR